MTSRLYPLGDNIGFVELIDSMGGDLSVVNDARASYDRSSNELTEKDKKLINYLIKHQHTSPLRGVTFKFRVRAPLLICRQWWKHVIASNHNDEQLGWNEKCVAGSQLVKTWGLGNLYTMERLYRDFHKGEAPYLISTKNNRIHRGTITGAFKNGKQHVYKVTSELGYSILTTLSHRYLTPEGYKELGDLKPGDKILRYSKEDHLKVQPIAIKYIEYYGEEETYDLEVAEYHNFCANQFFIHNSLRYVTIVEPLFYTPEVMRLQAKSNKQASEGSLNYEDNNKAIELYRNNCLNSFDTYTKLIEMGVCREQSRGVLPTSTYTTFVWTVSLQALLNFISLREGHGAQSEIAKYAEKIKTLIQPIVPYVYESYMNNV